MNLERLRILIAPALAGLFLVLGLCTFAVRRPPSVGFCIPMVRIHRSYGISCDGRFEFLRLTKDGKTWINQDEIPADQARARIAALMKDRAERIVYVMVDSDLSYGQFAEFLAKIEGATDDLHVVVVSGEIRREFEKPRKLIPAGKADHLDQEPLSVCDFSYSASQ